MFDFERTQSTGPVRTFTTPPLQPGRVYRYQATAFWGDDALVKDVSFQAGERVRVRMSRESAKPFGVLVKQPPPARQEPAPAAPDLSTVARVEEDRNFGIDTAQLAKLPSGEERIEVNGQPVAKADAKRLIEGTTGGAGALTDDSHKPRLTIIGSKEERQRVLADLDRQPDLKHALAVKAYAPDEWPVARAGFVTSGHPTIYLQAPDGKVLHRQDDYSGPQDFEAIRKADPNYKPTQDPDLRKLAFPGLSPDTLPWLVGGAALLLIALVSKRPA